MLRLGAIKMMLHGVEKITKVTLTRCLKIMNSRKFFGLHQILLLRAPLDHNSTSNDLLGTMKTKTEIVFLSLFLRTSKPGGRAAVIEHDDDILVRLNHEENLT